MDDKDVLDFFFELGMLKLTSEEGLKMMGVRGGNSVAEHNLRAAQIGYFLANMEGYEKPEEVALLLLFHEIGECRVGDIHVVARNYIKVDEEKAVIGQASKLGAPGKKILEMWRDYEYRNTRAGVIARDADWLEHAITARELQEQGYPGGEHWIDTVDKRMRTQSAKKLIAALRKANPSGWWKELNNP